MIIKWPVTAIPVGEKALPKCYCGEVFNHLVKWKMSKADFNTATKLISVLVFLSNFPRTIKCAVWVKPHHVAATTAQTALDTYLKWLDRKGHFCKTSRILPNTGWGKSVALMMCQLKPESLYFLGQYIGQLVYQQMFHLFPSQSDPTAINVVIPIQINRSIIWPHFNWCRSRIGKQQGKCYIAAFTRIYGFMAHNLCPKQR